MIETNETTAVSPQLEPTGYASLAYIEALPYMGEPLQLPTCGGWLLQRQVGESGFIDARGAYPFFCCADWQCLKKDVAAIGDRVVAVSLVTDPFCNFDEQDLRDCFPDRAIRFKTHFLVDLSEPLGKSVSKHHLRNVIKAQKSLKLFEADRPKDYLKAWCKLYSNLVLRHNLTGVQAFSDQSFARQFEVPGLRAFIAQERDTTVGMVLCFTQGPYSYYHLAAYDERGYELRASFGLFMLGLELLAADGVQMLNLGGAAGLHNAGAKANGLARFKQGWSNSLRDVWFCGRIVNQDAYYALCEKYGRRADDFFPAYQTGTQT